MKIKVIAQYDGHNVKSNKMLELKVKVPAADLEKSIMFTGLLNSGNIKVAAKLTDGKKPKTIGLFMVTNINFGSDGEAKVKFTTDIDYANTEVINKLIGTSFTLLAKRIDPDEDGDDDE